MERERDTALLIVAHGSTVNPDSSAPTLAHAAEIRRRNIFSQVECAFWKEEPSLRDARFLFDPGAIRDVCVVPNFISEGYFTHSVVPRELELKGRVTKRANGQVWKYCDPVGNHPMMTDLLLKRAQEVAPEAEPAETSLLIAAHGTDLNENSAVAAKREADNIRALGKYGNVLNVYMEEPPLVSDWRKLTKTLNVVVVPFFISDGLHSYEDIPVLLGIAPRHPDQSRGIPSPNAGPSSRDSSTTLHFARNDSESTRREVFRRNPYSFGDRSLYYAPSIGTDPGIADIILEQALSPKT